MSTEKLTRVVSDRMRAPRGMVHIPSEVEEHYRAIGCVLSVGFAAQEAVAQYQVRGRVPIFREELTDDVHKSLIRGGWIESKVDGTYRLGDCLLYVQPEEQRESNREEARLQWLQLDDEETYREEIERLNAALKSQTSPSVGAGLIATHLSSVSDHVRRGPIAEGQ